MEKNELLRLFDVEDIRNLPEKVMAVLTGDIERRNAIYWRLLELNDFNLSYDWFQDIYEAELSQRKQKKQDFTPNELGVLTARIALRDGECTIHEPTAGNGSMIIAAWHEATRKHIPFDYYPSRHMVTAWELSSRSIPLLLLNLSIRGIMGYVYNGDVLEGTIRQKYILLNKKDDALGFSDVVAVAPGASIRQVIP